MPPITSSQNPIIKLIRSLKEKKFRLESGLFVAEGWEMLNRAKREGWMPQHLLSTEAIPPWGEAKPMLVSEKVMASLSGQNNPHTVLATFRQLYTVEVKPEGTWIALEDMRDPGNLGTIIRTADAVSAAGIVLLGASCDPYSQECVRASTGSIFAVPLVQMETAAFVALSQSRKGDVVGTDSKATENFRRNYLVPTLLVMGSEGQGLSDELKAACKTLARIPMSGGAESLNVATATALMLYEIRKNELN